MAFGISATAYAIGGSAILGAYSSNKASKAAKASADKLAAQGDAAAQLGRDQFDWYKQEYEKTAPQREAAAALDAKVGDAQYRGMELATQQAQELDARNKGVFRPLEDSIVADAKAFNTEGKREQLAGEALTDVNSAFGAARGQQVRSQSRYGVTPGSGRAMALDGQMTTAQALASAGAMTKARRDASAEGYARKMDAVGLGRNIVGNQISMQQVAQNAGASAVGASGAGLGATQSGLAIMGQGFGAAQNGLATQGGLTSAAGRMSSEASAQQTSALTQLGLGVGNLAKEYDLSMAKKATPPPIIQSDEGIKTNTGKPADTKKALAEVDATKVDDGWSYDESKGAPPGSGGVERTGPMAQEVRRTMGDRVAPGGRQIDLVSMNGKLMASMQELSKRVKKIEKRVAA